MKSTLVPFEEWMSHENVLTDVVENELLSKT